MIQGRIESSDVVDFMLIGKGKTHANDPKQSSASSYLTTRCHTYAIKLARAYDRFFTSRYHSIYVRRSR